MTTDQPDTTPEPPQDSPSASPHDERNANGEPLAQTTEKTVQPEIGESGVARTDGQVKEGEENFTDAQRAFLACYREMGVIKRACKVAKVGRSSHYEWMEGNPAYRAAFEAAKEDAADTLEAEVYRRAVKGVRKAVGWYKGKAGGYVREYSDLLLMFQLKALRPDRYRERVDVRGVLAHLDVSALPDALIARLAAGENPITVLAPVLQAPELLALPPGSSDSSAPEGQETGGLRCR